MRTLNTILLCLWAFIVTAQGKTNDSLIAALKNSPQDTNRANLLIEICRNNLDVNNDVVARYATELLELSRKTNFIKGKADAYNFLGIIEDINANFGKALSLYDTAMIYARQGNLDKKRAGIDNNIGLIYWKIGDHQKALGYYYDALRVFEKLDERKLLANVYSNIGLIHASLKDQAKAIAYYNKALEIRRSAGDEYGMASVYNNLSKSYTYLQKEDSSRVYTKLAIDIQNRSGDEYGLAISMGNMGLSYTTTNNYDSATRYFNRSIELREKIDDKLGLIFVYHAMAIMYKKQRQFHTAAQYIEKALAIGKEINSRERVGTVSETAAYIYAELGDFKTAYKYMDQHAGYLDYIYDTVKSQQAEELTVKYEVEKKDLLIEKERATIQNRDLKLSQRNTQLALLIVLLIAAILSGWLLYNRYRLRQEARLQQEIIRQQDLASRAIIEAEERERKRIAGDLHDGLGQLASAIKMNLSTLQSQLDFKDTDTAIAYEKTLALTDQACRDVRVISHQMMPNVLLKSGLAAAVRDFLDKIHEKALQVHLDTFGLHERLDSNTETILYRVLQEVVNNVIKHSGANKLFIQLNKDEDGITATIEDNGIGFDANDLENYNGIGLKNIRSRIGFLKGTVEFDSAPGRGTVVSIWVPSKS